MDQPGISCNKCWGELGKPRTTWNNPEVTLNKWNKAKPLLFWVENDTDSDSRNM